MLLQALAREDFCAPLRRLRQAQDGRVEGYFIGMMDEAIQACCLPRG